MVCVWTEYLNTNSGHDEAETTMQDSWQICNSEPLSVTGGYCLGSVSSIVIDVVRTESFS